MPTFAPYIEALKIIKQSIQFLFDLTSSPTATDKNNLEGLCEPHNRRFGYWNPYKKNPVPISSGHYIPLSELNSSKRHIKHVMHRIAAGEL
jgi:hypothetical protein